MVAFSQDTRARQAFSLGSWEAGVEFHNRRAFLIRVLFGRRERGHGRRHRATGRPGARHLTIFVFAGIGGYPRRQAPQYAHTVTPSRSIRTWREPHPRQASAGLEAGAGGFAFGGPWHVAGGRGGFNGGYPITRRPFRRSSRP